MFVGRCADYVLRDRKDVVNIFITATLEDRIKAVCERHQCDEETARHIIKDKENSVPISTTTIPASAGDMLKAMTSASTPRW